MRVAFRSLATSARHAAAALRTGEAVRADRTSLQDTFGRFHDYLRISLTERCNLRCQYCMPEEGVDLTPARHLLRAEELFTLGRIFVDMGVRKIRLTGGEPTVRADFLDVALGIADLDSRGLQSLGITTNGLLMERKVIPLFEAVRGRLRMPVNVSLDTLQQDKFERITRRLGFDRVLSGIYAAVNAGVQIKINVVVMRGVNEDEIVDFVALTKSLPVEVRFIEFMPFDGNEWGRAKLFSYQEMINLIQASGYELQRCSDEPTATSKTYAVPGHAGKVGFISSMSEHFCGGCNRVRLMADGNFKVCLFGASEVSLRDGLRGGASESDMQCMISAAILRKKKQHAGMDVLAVTPNRPMIKIGG